MGVELAMAGMAPDGLVIDLSGTHGRRPVEICSFEGKSMELVHSVLMNLTPPFFDGYNPAQRMPRAEAEALLAYPLATLAICSPGDWWDEVRNDDGEWMPPAEVRAALEVLLAGVAARDPVLALLCKAHELRDVPAIEDLLRLPKPTEWLWRSFQANLERLLQDVAEVERRGYAKMTFWYA